MGFTFSGDAAFEGLKIDQGSEENAKPQMFAKFRVDGVSCKSVAAILGSRGATQVEEAFFKPALKDAERPPLFIGLTSITSASFWEQSHGIKFFDDAPVLQVKRLGHFKLIAKKNATFEVEFVAQIEDPPRGLIDRLMRWVKRSLMIELSGDLVDQAESKDAKQGTRGKHSRASSEAPPISA